jgi:Dienelactone hydrolase and related enzymes
MIMYRNHSDTLIIVLHEIYGINEHITKTCRGLADAGYDVVCPDLLDGRPPYDYSREEEAYRYFLNFAGLEPSAKRVAFLARQEEREYRHIFLLGYSAGATIAWLCGGDFGKYDGSLVYSGIICYYGSRIRDYTELMPKCPALLLFAEEEKAFDPLQLSSDLGKEKTEVHILKGMHGFADPYSPNYNKASAAEANQITVSFLERMTGKDDIT